MIFLPVREDTFIIVCDLLTVYCVFRRPEILSLAVLGPGDFNHCGISEINQYRIMDSTNRKVITIEVDSFILGV